LKWADVLQSDGWMTKINFKSTPTVRRVQIDEVSTILASDPSFMLLISANFNPIQSNKKSIKLFFSKAISFLIGTRNMKI
jgi:hypothetical protein